MATTTSTQIRINPTVKKQASALFAELGIDMSSAVNMFLRQCILRGGLPFPVALPRYSQETLQAMAEARQIAHDPSVPSYTSLEELKKALDESNTPV